MILEEAAITECPAELEGRRVVVKTFEELKLNRYLVMPLKL
jgi:hypothetical protein